MPTVQATRYVTPLREGGSLPAIVEADDEGMYVLKFRGAGQGPKALVAELISGQLGRAIGLPVPDLVFVGLDPVLANAEPDPEIQDLLRSSAGTNFGIDYLPGSLSYSAASPPPLDPELAADLVWFDALVMNVDRTARNPNLLLWGGKLWMIDHGAALYVQHSWNDPAEQALNPFKYIASHVLLPAAGSIEAASERLSPRVTQDLLGEIVESIPEVWLGDDPPAERSRLTEFLTVRAANSESFTREAESARTLAV